MFLVFATERTNTPVNQSTHQTARRELIIFSALRW